MNARRREIMKLTEIRTAEEYLSYYEESIDWSRIASSFPATYALYTRLYEDFCLECHQASNHVFQTLRKMLEIDAQLQIMDEIFKRDLDLGELLEDEELVNMIIHDKQSFYRENVGLRTNDQVPWGLIYLSEQY